MFFAFRLSEPSSTFAIDLDSRTVHLESPHTHIPNPKSITEEETSMEMSVKRLLRIGSSLLLFLFNFLYAYACILVFVSVPSTSQRNEIDIDNQLPMYQGCNDTVDKYMAKRKRQTNSLFSTFKSIR
ncbi:uncharacterized protein LOC114877603 [Osmia bicornis bicornis]|uniref:uncharacterized protein LOC114877603 n=1 Tax=Osmia bicornis bicornis TaxID=1437191 RepID=UPI001EAF5EF7|nr:uncharacterized protein LOC114877603 [Osmia bicornis bicornis]